MAQDFKAAFYPGRDNKCITTLEFDGVELAAIKGLNQKLEEIAATMELRRLISQMAENESIDRQSHRSTESAKEVVIQ